MESRFGVDLSTGFNVAADPSELNVKQFPQ
jgi:hypothetical protein